MRRSLKRILPLLLLAALVGASFGVGCSVSELVGPKRQAPPKEINLVNEAWQVVFEDYVDKEQLDPRKLAQDTIRAMVEALNDPYSVYIDAQHYNLEHSRFEGTFGGIGASITTRDGRLAIGSPIPGGPADRAGIKSGDVILEINGEPAKDLSSAEAVLKIRGSAGTDVTLTLLHAGDTEPVSITVTREEIQIPSIIHEMLSDNVAYVQITYFSSRTEAELVSALTDVQAQGATGIILDMRNNPGGLLDAAVAVASQFLEDGTVVSTLYGSGAKETWDVKPGGAATNIPLAVLVNSDSASASEVVAGAIQDYERGVLVGTRTLGKGSVDHFRVLSDGSAIYIAIGRWYTPDGRLIEGLGLTPDLEVGENPGDGEDVDIQLERAIEYLKAL